MRGKSVLELLCLRMRVLWETFFRDWSLKRRSKKHLFLWLRNRTTENRKGKKAQNIKGKWQSKNFSTVWRPPVVLPSSPSADISITRRRANFSTRSPKPSGFGFLSLCLDKNLPPMKLKQELFFWCKDLLSGTIRFVETGADWQTERSTEAWRGNSVKNKSLRTEGLK